MAGQREGQQRLAGLSALVTGGSRGIGLAIAQALTQAGCGVTIMGRHAASLDEAVRNGAAKHQISADVTDLDALAALMAGNSSIFWSTMRARPFRRLLPNRTLPLLPP